MAVDGIYDQLQLQEIDDATYEDLTNVPNIPNGLVLVPVQIQSGGTGFVLVQKQSGGTGLVPVQMQSGGTGSVLGSSPDTRLLKFKRTSPQALGYIIAGSLTVAADRSMSRCMIKASMGMNIVAAMVSGVAIIFYSLDGAWVINRTVDSIYDRHVHDRDVPYYMSLSIGMPGVLVQCVFNLLVFFISIRLSFFGCKATCCHRP